MLQRKKERCKEATLPCVVINDERVASCGSGRAAGDHLESEQAAVQCAEIDRIPAVWPEPHCTRKVKIIGNDVKLPACIVPLELAGPFCPQVWPAVESLAIGRVGDNRARLLERRMECPCISLFKVDVFGLESGTLKVALCRSDGVGVGVNADHGHGLLMSDVQCLLPDRPSAGFD